jgi:TolB protein
MVILFDSCNKDEPEPEIIEFTVRGGSPVWSPDGSKIAFLISDTLYTMDNDGTGKILLATGVFSKPEWSGDGKYLLYTGIWANIFRVSTDGAELLNLTNDAYQCAVPTWSPDNQHIAFISIGITGDLYIMNKDGSNVTKLTSLGTCSPFQAPKWINGSSSLFFLAGYDGATDFTIVNTDGSNLHQITNETIWEGESSISDDGTKICFAGSSGSNWNIYTMNNDGTSLKSLTGNEGNNHYPSLSPDNLLIMFQSYRNGADGIYLMHYDGSNLKLIFDKAIYEVDWSPIGRRICYVTIMNGVSMITSYSIAE